MTKTRLVFTFSLATAFVLGLSAGTAALFLFNTAGHAQAGAAKVVQFVKTADIKIPDGGTLQRLEDSEYKIVCYYRAAMISCLKK